MNNRISNKTNIIYLMVLIAFFYLRWKLNLFVGEKVFKIWYLDFPYYPLSIDVLKFVVNTMFGGLLATGVFSSWWSQKGRWKFDFQRAFITILPLLILLAVKQLTHSILLKDFLTYCAPLFHVVIGYTGLICFNKEAKDETNINNEV